MLLGVFSGAGYLDDWVSILHFKFLLWFHFCPFFLSHILQIGLAAF